MRTAEPGFRGGDQLFGHRNDGVMIHCSGVYAAEEGAINLRTESGRSWNGVSGYDKPEVRAVGPDAEALLRSVVETSDDAILIVDAKGDIATWSGTAERLFGTEGRSALGSRLEILFPDHLRPLVLSILARAVAGEPIMHFESEIVRSDGLPTPIWLSMSLVAGTEDPSSCVVVIARDVTEQHLAQATLAEVESRLQEGEALSHVGSWLWDLRTGAVQWSAEFHQIHGIDPFDFDGTFESHLGLIRSDDRADVRAAMEDAVALGRPFEREYTIVRPDGHTRVLHVRAQPSFGSAGTAVGLRGIGQDVTKD